MRPLIVALFFLVPLVGGCLGDGKGASAGLKGDLALPKIPTTVEEVLATLPQLKILGPTTLGWSLANGTVDKPESVSHLVYMNQKFRASDMGHESGAPVLFAMIPVVGLEGSSSCAPITGAAKAYFRGRDGTTGNNRFNNVSGDYEAGYYHAVMVTDAPASFTISFGVEDPGKPRKLPAPDVYVNASAKLLTGQREISHPVSIPGGTWFAWATHRIGGTNTQTFDGGRTHSVTIGGDCAKTTVTDSGLTIQNNARARSVSAWGTQAGFEVAGKYAPNQGAASSTTTTLDAAWVWVQPIVLPTPPESRSAAPPP